MKAVIVFFIGVAVGWMLLPRLEPEPTAVPGLRGVSNDMTWTMTRGTIITADPRTWTRTN